MSVICPGDPVEVRLALRAALQHDGPVYIRIGKKGEPIVHRSTPEFALGRGITLRDGEDVCLLSTGNMLPTAMAAAEQLDGAGVAARVVSMHTVKPLDEELLAEVFPRYRVVASVEEHSRLGGLGGSIAEWLTDHPVACGTFLRIGTADTFLHEAGDEHHARQHFGLTAGAIAEQIAGACAAGSHNGALASARH